MSQPSHAYYDFFKSCLSFQKHSELNVFNRFDLPLVALKIISWPIESMSLFKRSDSLQGFDLKISCRSNLSEMGNVTFSVRTLLLSGGHSLKTPSKDLMSSLMRDATSLIFFATQFDSIFFGVSSLYTKSAFPCPF